MRVHVLTFAVIFAGCLISRDEVARTNSPSRDVDAVVVETNGGATTSFGYEIHLVPAGRSKYWGTRVARLHGAVRSGRAYGVNLRWRGPAHLDVEYLRAESAVVESGGSFKVSGKTISVTLTDGIDDPKACPGGMLYDLKMSNMRDADCDTTRR
jgi:hypothetical protein